LIETWAKRAVRSSAVEDAVNAGEALIIAAFANKLFSEGAAGVVSPLRENELEPPETVEEALGRVCWKGGKSLAAGAV
jgi:hypothetical protein